jgi:hypothetical protein
MSTELLESVRSEVAGTVDVEDDDRNSRAGDLPEKLKFLLAVRDANGTICARLKGSAGCRPRRAAIFRDSASPSRRLRGRSPVHVRLRRERVAAPEPQPVSDS